MKTIRGIAQGSEEWLALRCGIPTASSFDMVMTPGMKPSKSQERYMMRLLAERCKGGPSDEFISMFMKRGSEYETKARRYYQFQRECEVDQVTFITNDAGTIGGSPDGLIGDDGLVEFKAPKDETHMMYLLGAGTVYDDYKIQAQGLLWLTGRKWVDVMSYHPELPEALIRTERDEPFIIALSSCVEAFSTALETKFAELVARGWAKQDWRQVAPQKEWKQPERADLEEFNRLHAQAGRSN